MIKTKIKIDNKWYAGRSLEETQGNTMGSGWYQERESVSKLLLSNFEVDAHIIEGKRGLRSELDYLMIVLSETDFNFREITIKQV